jgi:ABC-2 type transport system permease protein
MKLRDLIGTECMKLRRSKVTWISLAAYLVIGLFVGLMLWIVGHPGTAERLGLLGQKVSFASSGVSADWKGLLALFAEMGGVGGMILYSIVVSYVFGREYAEGTAKNMLGLPLKRGFFVAAKLAVSSLWFLALTLALIAESLASGALLGLSGFSWPLFLREAGNILVAALLSLALGPTVAWIAVASEGYLAPLGFTIFSLVLGTAFGATAWARWVPWSIVPLFSGLAGPRVEELGPGSYLVMAAFFALTALGASARFSRADNTQ